MPRRPTTAAIYQIKITLKGTKPPIWRRVLVPGDIPLSRLHRIVQAAMGWTTSHLHAFIIEGVEYGEPSAGYGLEMVNEQRVSLNRVVAGEKTRFRYQYDFGDDWQHELLIEKVLPPDPDARYPVCVAGRRACPPEDCGGVWGYAGFLEALVDPLHPEHDTMVEWIGGSFDPEAFDLEATNQRLASVR